MREYSFSYSSKNCAEGKVDQRADLVFHIAEQHEINCPKKMITMAMYSQLENKEYVSIADRCLGIHKVHNLSKPFTFMKTAKF